ncbi:MAG TPA: GNAT family N-acetyltransferase [Candidatus Angelobacter sp.]|nr:GNAT family N-acetyltransferase [Candidatus Angelobacter sp.]
MSLPDDLSLRDATLDDLGAIAALRESVDWTVHEWALRLVIERTGARCVVATDPEGTVVAVGSGIVYGPLGFVGNMIVSAGQRRRGLGSAILEAVLRFLEDAGCTRLELNATSDGRPLYERHGFRSIGRSSAAAFHTSAGLTRDPSITPRRAGPADLDALADYDRPRFGGDRRALLDALLTDEAAAILMAERDGALCGYGCVRSDTPRLGPLVAEEPSVAETLLVDALELLPPATVVRLSLPPNNRTGAAWLRRIGAVVEPWDGRMARGEPLPKREETIYGMTVGALG